MRTFKKTVLSSLLFLMTALPVFALDFELTPAGAELLRELGSTGHLYWGLYRGC